MCENRAEKKGLKGDVSVEMLLIFQNRRLFLFLQTFQRRQFKKDEGNLSTKLKSVLHEDLKVTRPEDSACSSDQFVACLTSKQSQQTAELYGNICKQM